MLPRRLPSDSSTPPLLKQAAGQSDIRTASRFEVATAVAVSEDRGDRKRDRSDEFIQYLDENSEVWTLPLSK